MKAQIQALSNLLNQKLSNSAAGVEANQQTNVPDKNAQKDQEPATTVPKEEPEDAEPPQDDNDEEPEAAKDDTDEVIQSLEDHLAATQEEPLTPAPQPPQESGDDSGVEVPETNEPNKIFTMSGYETEDNPAREQAIREQVLQDSEEEHPGIEKVASSSQ